MTNKSLAAKPGDKIKVITKNKTHEGMLMPNEETDNITIKLDSGYNMGINKSSITSIKVLKKAKIKSSKNILLIKDKNKPTIAVLHTGGTIASKVDYSSGGVVASFSSEDLIEMFPELKEIANVEANLISNMMSEDIRFTHYKQIAKAVAEQIKNKVDGIIIGHGTDTLAVTAAAISFAFEKLPVPVIFVGSQRSTDRGSSDGAMNLICAAEFISKTDFAGVAICMHENTDDNNCVILPATKTRKMHTTRRDAFKSINTGPIATIDYNTKKIKLLTKKYNKKDKNHNFLLKDKFEGKVGILKTYPNMSREIIDVFTKNNYKGLVLETTGLGQAPTNIKENLPNYEALKGFIKKGGIIVLTSQCVFGRVHEDVYTNCRRLKDIGIIYGGDMITETAYVKLAWLLGNYKKDEAKKYIQKNLRGEITDRTGTDFLD
ncbi:Glu-tRNA(Gln) amidotransferase subunit GatD [Candidatus Woesearchaeota archaeon]|nr:Glu-tRNA(Gln) amidotransferase subunit GatD [Candidatus Woesearchaeota archaeon]